MDTEQREKAMIGKTIGDYELLSKLGRGGVGVVYLAKNVRTGDHVAVKMLHSHLLEHERARSRFQREAEVLARLRHPGIVQVLDFLQIPEGFFMVLEFVRGETLDSGVQRLGAFPWSRAVPWFVEVLDALEYAHSKNIIHRDVKPANVLVEMSGHVKVLDFGMAKLLDAKRQLTAPGMTLGTICYMSKEQLLGKALDARSDVYSLAVSLYEVATGHLPFWSEKDQELALAIARKDPKPPSELNDKLSPEVDAILLKALEKNPDDRYADAKSFKEALQSTI